MEALCHLRESIVERPLIEFKNFTFQYRAQAEPTLFNINLEIRKGEKILICGPSGCGKSTLSNSLNGLIPSTYDGESTGELYIGGRSFKELDIFKLSKITGTVLQDSDGQFIGLTVGEDIAFALENDNIEQRLLKARVLEAAKRVGMDAYLDHAPQELSGGQKQRVSLAGVMVDDVELFLFDEPLANLDPATGKSTIELIDEIHKTSDAAIVIIEHRLEDVLYRDIDRIILMQDGRIVCDTTPDKLLASSLLKDAGIREPLYVTALKYAGVDITEEKRPGHIETLMLDEDDKSKVRAWFHDAKLQNKEDNREVLLKVDDLSFSYPNGVEALKHIDFSLKRGEMISIVGKNGAGKSTFSKILCGFERQSSGSITFEGKSFDDLSIKERAEHIGYVMQNPNQMITKPLIRDEVSIGLEMLGDKSKEDIAAIVDDTLRICGLWQFRSWPISALSFGQKKRVTIASILSMHPDVLILDEPTAGQDFKHYTSIMEFLRKLNDEGITIILITHDMHLMLEYSERAVVFTSGEKLADTTPENILSDAELSAKASLKKTSLSDLANLCELPESAFIRRFIEYDREARHE